MIWKCVSAVLALLLCGVVQAQEDDPTEARLDAACESAREAKLAPIRQQYTRECIDKGNDPGYCERYNSTFGDGTASRGPLYYELPECESAYQYKKDNRP